MKVLELFAGSRSVGKIGDKMGMEVFSVDWEKYEDIDLNIDVEFLKINDIPFVPDVIWASPDCFAEGHLIRLSDGYKKIETIKIGDKVLTHENRYKKVYNIMNKTVDSFYNLKISGSEMLRVTGEHPFLVKKKNYIYKNRKFPKVLTLGKNEWVKVKDLNKNYRVGVPINKESIIPKWNGINITLKNQFGVETNINKNIISNVIDKEEFWWIIGRYMGDGWFRYSDRYDFDICCDKNEDVEISQVLDKLGVFKYTLSEKITTKVFSISSKELSYFVSRYGKGGEHKSIPDEILNLPKNLLKSFLDGYISSDGYIIDKKNGNKCISLSTISYQLAYGFQKCVNKVYGRYCSLIVKPERKTKILGRDVNCKKQYTLSFYIDKKTNYYSIDEDYVWVNIRNLKLIKNKINVYNLSVEDDESYTVNNFSVHNCTTYTIAAISHHRNGVEPKSEYAKKCDNVNQHFIGLIKEWLEINPNLVFFIENPRGMLRKMTWMQEFQRHTIWYCKYGDDRAKPTDIWTNSTKWIPRPICHNGNKNCHHQPAPRGSKTGTQGKKGHYERSRIPEQLCSEILESCK